MSVLDESDGWTVGELSRETGLTVRALHHYDEIGLLRPRGRTHAGYRLYSIEEVERLHVIVALRDLGLPLEQIRHALTRGPEQVAESLRGQLPEVERQLLSVALRKERLLEVLYALEAGTDNAFDVLRAAPCRNDDANPKPNENELVGKTLKIGAVYSLTGYGNVYGNPSRNGVLMAQDDINRSGGVLGAMVSVWVEDDSSDKTIAARRTQSLIEDHNAIALMGPGISHLAAAAHPVANTLRTPMIASSNPGSHIVGPGCPYPCDFIFRTSMGENEILSAGMGAYCDSVGPQTGVLMCTSDDKNSADGGQYVGGNAGNHGIRLSNSIEFSKTEEDVSDYVLGAVQSDPEVIFITSVGDVPARLMKAAREMGFEGLFFGGGSFNPGAVTKSAGLAGRGALSVNTWHVDNGASGNGEFVRSYRHRFHRDPDQFAVQGYVGMLMIADAAGRARLSFTDVAADRLRLHRALETTDIGTPMGRMRFTPQHDIAMETYLVEMDGRAGHNLVRATSAY